MKRMFAGSISVLLGLGLAGIASSQLGAQAVADAGGKDAPPAWLVSAVNAAPTIDGVISAEGHVKGSTKYMLVRAQRLCTEWDALWLEIKNASTGLSLAMPRVGCWPIPVRQSAQVPESAESQVTFWVTVDPPTPGALRNITTMARTLNHVIDAEMWRGDGTGNTDDSRVLAVWWDSGYKCFDPAITNLLKALNTKVSEADIPALIQKRDCVGMLEGPNYRPPPYPAGPMHAFLRQVTGF